MIMGSKVWVRLFPTLAVMGFLVLSFFLVDAESQERKSKKKPSTETNMFNFFRIFIMRLVYGFASMFGGEEALEDFMGGAFVPPGADDADYRDYFNGDDDDDY